ncbi:MAG: adenine deaminase [Bacteroidales bacterium]|jgi:adenine deaminase
MGIRDFELKGNIVDVVGERIFKGVVVVKDSKIAEIREENHDKHNYILPGLIDSHIHIESSMLVPSEFAKMAVVHGTIGTVSDPHEIANVMGLNGVRFMVENGKNVPFRFYFGAPSCVPATTFETAGSSLGIEELDELLRSDDILYLSEMMNFPGVLFGDELVTKKLTLARHYGKPVDGHAPGLSGENAKKYIQAGISTDHECYMLQEAAEKIELGMKILIREGSAAKNFETLAELIPEHSAMIMFCSDDKHPNDLVLGHINQLVKGAFGRGYDKIKVLQCATLNPVKHYKLDAGLLQKGDSADFIIVDDLENFNILATYINGKKVAEDGKSLITSVPITVMNCFHAEQVKKEDILVKPEGRKMRVIKAIDDQLLTEELIIDARIDEKEVKSNQNNDILKIVVLNRYNAAPPAVGFIHGFGLKSGAIASSIAHDSHNIIAIGTDDEYIVKAINEIIISQGGISVVFADGYSTLPLPVAGIMSNDDGYKVAENYRFIDELVKTKLKCSLKAPFMTLSFMALLVIPKLKISDKGLFDGEKFSFTDLFEKYL